MRPSTLQRASSRVSGALPLFYGLVYRNIPDDLFTARLVNFILTCVLGYFLLLNIRNGCGLFIVIEAINMILAICLVYEMSVMQPQKLDT